jgi:hypothetical protein
MSARLAAAALVTYDADIADAVRKIHEEQGGKRATWSAAESFAAYLRGCWTLSLAAHAAGTTEEKVVAALLLYFVCAGTSTVCRGIARRAFKL